MPPAKTNTPRKRKPEVNLETLGLEIGNKPPQALDVEEAVLGAMLLEASCVDMAMEELNASCFYDPKHKMIFEAMASLVTDHTSVDIITVSSKLKAQGNLEIVGGPVVLANLSEKVGSAAHIEYYTKILKQKTIQRDLISASYEILRDSYDESVKVDDLIDKAQNKIFDAIQNSVRKEVQDIGSVINEAMKNIEDMQGNNGLSGVPSGFLSIDTITMGWQKSDLIILAARPSVGKTAFSLNIVRNAAVDHNMPVAFFSLEMPAIQLAKRLMTSETGLEAEKIKGGVRLQDYEWQQLEYKLKDLSKAPIYIDDTPSLPIMEFRTKAKNLVKNKGVRLIVVDYLQLMQGPPELRGMREQEVAAISRTLKATAKELDVPIIALSQLSRQAAQRQGGGGKPVLSDLRESGSIEQDADMVIFIHRPDAVGLSETPEDREKTFIIIAKHRNGQTAEIEMIFKGDQIKFMESNDTLDIRAASMPMESAMNSDEF
ncbi:MAG: replicative DNA helicase [Bacteroidales bacterium]|nr:replicative DNA helicase [Bacteroidales bacterium]MBQ5581980.1 replicative DNA helicase [Bacteroidales bacterium]MBQ5639585.1 replicative DNA helicase [Bacteroidales bacterium]